MKLESPEVAGLVDDAAIDRVLSPDSTERRERRMPIIVSRGPVYIPAGQVLAGPLLNSPTDLRNGRKLYRSYTVLASGTTKR
jgi:hypothetical protein